MTAPGGEAGSRGVSTGAGRRARTAISTRLPRRRRRRAPCSSRSSGRQARAHSDTSVGSTPKASHARAMPRATMRLAAKRHRERREVDCVDASGSGDLDDVGRRPEADGRRRRGVDRCVEETAHRVERRQLPVGDRIGDQPVEERSGRHGDAEVAGDEGEVQVDLDSIVTDQRDVLAVPTLPTLTKGGRHPVESDALERGDCAVSGLLGRSARRRRR